MDKIFFNQMRFYAYHGVYSEENRLGQRFMVDLELGLNLQPAAQADDLKKTVNYADVYNKVKQEVEETQVKLVETLAERIATCILAEDQIEEVRVRVTKPDPPIAGHYDAVGVEIVRRKS
ncbi:dihydroneopterin aldolase [Hazenella sp. IB182357]|uniref:7,8-dihydroneopterin aldolase n=1 Tax=Polycladospora coralii TaxID=2771432 RepID=A0A926NBR6_9BACL|nr:dihydroneopterin aldolase [Polycladospora coralii]MBD1372440.1 dihydroneopterin aldolase [Polycladospora coralii]MBS7531762.1 dihydroneopterin aldolase [Polycladospora coralii]